MSARAPDAPWMARRPWTALLLLSALFHVAILGAFALQTPPVMMTADAAAMAVSFADPPPFIRPSAIAKSSRPHRTRPRLVMLDAPRRYAASAQAATGEAADAVDLFGPVFADGLWPRPLLVRSEPCDPEDDPDTTGACRRELMLIGLASEPPAGSKAQP